MARRIDDLRTIAKLKAHIEILSNRLVELGESPSMLIDAGMFYRQRGRVTVKSAISGYIERKRESGADCVGVKMIRDAIKKSVPLDESSHLTKAIRHELALLEESGLIEMQGDRVRI